MDAINLAPSLALLNTCYTTQSAVSAAQKQTASEDMATCGKEWNAWVTLHNEKLILGCYITYAKKNSLTWVWWLVGVLSCCCGGAGVYTNQQKLNR